MERGPYKKAPVNLADVIIDAGDTKAQKIRSYVKQVKDPYKVRIEGTLVEMEYSEDGPTMQELVEMAVSIDR